LTSGFVFGNDEDDDNVTIELDPFIPLDINGVT
jgi:hypothetical protein